MYKQPCTGVTILKGAQNPEEVESQNKNRFQSDLLVEVKATL